MASKSDSTYAERAKTHSNALVRKLFSIAEAKRSNVILSADLTTTGELLKIANKLGPYTAVFKTHIDIVSDFGRATVDGLKSLSNKHTFLIFEDRKFIDIGNTVQKQYRGGALRISEWAHFVNASILAGDGIVDAIEKISTEPSFQAHGSRGLLILAEMITSGSLAVGDYTLRSIESARAHSSFVVGFVAMQALTSRAGPLSSDSEEDFVVFTTGVNRSSKGDSLGQQYNTPERAVAGGSDFIISGRGIYAAPDPVAAVKLYQEEGWKAYLARTGQQ